MTVVRTYPGGAERGAVLVVVVLVVVAMLGVGHGLVLAARYELVAARAGARHLEARAAAETAVERALDAGGGAWMDSVGEWEESASAPMRVGRMDARVAWRRLTAEAWQIEAAARGARGPEARWARLAWVLDPVERVLAWPGVIGVAPGAPVTLLGSVDAARVADPDPPLTSLLCDVPSGAPGARLGGVTALHQLPPGQLRPPLGRLSFDTLLALGAPHLDGVGTPAPLEGAGVCLDATWSWGDPERPHRPCGAHLPLRTRIGDLRVDGGTGQGILVVDGDLTLAAGARYYGVVLVSGRIEMLGGASLTGYAVAPGGLMLAADARVRGSACRALRALRGNAAELRMAFPMAEPLGPL